MMFKKNNVLAWLLVFVLIITCKLKAVTLVEDFNDGITLTNWDTFQTDAAGSPWTISADSGDLGISKSADNDSTTMYEHLMAGIKSKFALDGDFSISVDFNLVTLPLTPQYGWNEAILKIYTDQGGEFYALRFTNNLTNKAEGFCNIDPYVLNVIDSGITTGTLKINREGDSMFAYLGTETGEIFLGQKSSSLFGGLAYVQLYAAHAWDYPGPRPNTNLDVRFDDFSAIADNIIPEPCTLALLAIGGLALRKRRF